MRYVFLFIAALFFLSFGLTDEDVIIWNKDRKLTWNDYRGKPQKRFAAASTVYSLGRKVLVQEGKPYARIQAYFYCNDSWKKEEWISESVLNHEQRHFDIVEWYCRLMRKQISEMKFRDLKEAEQKVDSLYEVANAKMDALQDRYDEETDGSMNGEKQREWNRKIEKEMAALEKHSQIFVPLKVASGN